MSFDSVEMSDTRSAYELTKTLIEHGHRKIGGILKYDDMQGIARYKGLIQCMSDYELNMTMTASDGILPERWKTSSVRKDLLIFTVTPESVQQ